MREENEKEANEDEASEDDRGEENKEPRETNLDVVKSTRS